MIWPTHSGLTQDNELDRASDLFSKVLQVRVKHYGDLSIECASAFYRYGATLLYQAQDAGDVFGGPLQASGPEEFVGKENRELDAKGKGRADEEAAEEEEEEQGEHGEEHSGGEGSSLAATDLQLAWENLETAKIIWSKNPTAHASELADVQLLLGDIKLEDEDWDAALMEYDDALKYLVLCGSKPSDRRRADVQFKRCLVLEFMQQPADALLAAQAANESLQDRYSALKEEMAKASDDGTASKLNTEVADIGALIKEMKYKIEELEEAVQENEATKTLLKTALAQTVANAGATEQATCDDASGSVVAEKPQVQNLGVVGRGTKRITLAPTPADPPKSEGISESKEPGTKKARSVEDLMGEEAATFGAVGEIPLPAFLEAKAVGKTHGTDENK